MRGAVAVVVGTLVAMAAAISAAAGDFLDLLPPPVAGKAPEPVASWGFDWGEDVPDAQQVVLLARQLAAAVPERVQLVPYATSLEGRPLVLLVVASEANLARLAALRSTLDTLADPRRLPGAEAGRLLADVPAVVWIAGSVHGDEASGGDAALALASYLATSQTPEVAEILANCVVIVDPLQNPDGRDRFVTSLRQARGRAPDAEPASAEHQQPWPGGRFSHDLFDLNRDWLVLSHPETRGRVAAMLAWHPMVAVDLHEMGAEQGYFFPPPAAPHHPFLTGEHLGLWDTLGRRMAAAFDEKGWRYWTREVFDSFYPGYGETWPSLLGAVGMTFEQASARGPRTRLKDGSVLTHRDAVRHHLLAAFTTCTTVARERQRFVRAWFEYRMEAVRSGGKRAMVLASAADPTRAAELADLLVRHGIEVFRQGDSYVAPLGQPAGFLLRTMLERHTPMDEAFEAEQVRREAKRLPDEIYDVTAWSLPLLWGVDVTEVADWSARSGAEPVTAGVLPQGKVVGEGRVAFLVPWTGVASARVLAALLAQGWDVGVAAKPFRLAGRDFPRGTLVVRSGERRGELRAACEALAARFGVDVVGADSGYADSGIDLGSNSVLPLRPPRVAVLWDTPTSPTSAGHLRHALETTIGYPVTVLRASGLRRADLGHFDVIILPDARGGGYATMLGEGGVARLAQWVRDGGTLVAVGDAGRFLAEEKVALLGTTVEKRTKTPPATTAEEGHETARFNLAAHVVPEEEDPPPVPGAILRVTLEGEHLLAAGFPAGAVNVLVDSRRVFLPLKLDKGRNVGVYAGEEDLVQSGFVFDASRRMLARKGYLLVQDHGKGRVIVFAEDPAVRALPRGSMLLLANAVFFGPALGADDEDW